MAKHFCSARLSFAGAWAMACALASLSCAATHSSAAFSGNRASSIAPPANVQEAPVVPLDHTLIGEVRSECTLTEGRDRIDNEWLSDVDCTDFRLTEALANAASWSGGDLLVARSCHAGRRSGRRVVVDCSAKVARPLRPAPATPGVATPALVPVQGAQSDLTLAARRLDDPSGVQAWRMRADFTPVGIPAARAPRRADAVAEVTAMPVAAHKLGTVTVTCSRGPCSVEGVRAGVRVAAGRLGASHVSNVRCVEREDEPTCVGDASLIGELGTNIR
jgi:hypothetical protein